MHSFDPRLLLVQPFVPHAYSDLIAQGAFPSERITSEEQYQIVVDKFNELKDVSVNRIIYKAGKMQVIGVLATSEKLQAKSHPILIFNRGGSGELGKLTVGQIMRYLVPFAAEGFLVFASNYRGNDGGDGKDEFGGADIQDVLELLDIARHSPAWDNKNAFMLGDSRGGMMTYLAIKHGARLQAAATIAAPTDLRKAVKERADIADSLAKRIVDFAHAQETATQARSAICWPQQLNVPLLLLHGDADARVPVTHTLALANALEKAGKKFEVVIYPQEDHFLSRQRKNALEEIKRWFTKHKMD